MKSAQHNCNFIADIDEDLMSGVQYVNFMRAHKLRLLSSIDLDTQLMHPKSKEAQENIRWRPLSGKRFAESLAMVCCWKNPKTGRYYRGIRASNAEIALALEINEKQWRREAYVRDGKMIARPGTRAWCQHHELVAVLSTTQRTAPGRPHRDGVPRTFGHGPHIYLPGRALKEQLTMRKRRIRKNERRVLTAVWRKLRKRKTFPTKSSAVFSFEKTTALRASGRARTLTMVQQRQSDPPVVDGVVEQTRRPTPAPAAPLADERHVPCTSVSRQINQEPEGSEGQDAGAGGDAGAPRQIARAARGEAIATSGVTPPSPASGSSGAAEERASVLLEQAAALERVDPKLRELLERVQRAHDDRLSTLGRRGELAETGPPAPKPSAPRPPPSQGCAGDEGPVSFGRLLDGMGGAAGALSSARAREIAEHDQRRREFERKRAEAIAKKQAEPDDDDGGDT